MGRDAVTAHTDVLEEWKARYESYRAYRAQYLTTLSLAATAWLVGLGFALGKDMVPFGRILLLGLLAGASSALIIAHFLARTAIIRLGRRLRHLESELGFSDFDTVWLLRTALAVTLTLSFVGLLASILMLLAISIGCARSWLLIAPLC